MTGAAPRDKLATSGLKSTGIGSPSAMPLSTRSPGPVREPQEVHLTGRRREVALGNLGVEPHLNRMTARLGRLSSRTPPRAT